MGEKVNFSQFSDNQEILTKMQKHQANEYEKKSLIEK
jgi:hypothetical protein